MERSDTTLPSRHARLSSSLPVTPSSSSKNLAAMRDTDESTPLLTGTSQHQYTLASTSTGSPLARLRVNAICPNIHCPSCISHLSQLLTQLVIPNVAIHNVSVSLIDRSVQLEAHLLAAPHVGSMPLQASSASQHRFQRRHAVESLKLIANVLSDDGFPVDSIQARSLESEPGPSSMSRSLSHPHLLSTSLPSHQPSTGIRRLDIVIDRDELYQPFPSRPALPTTQSHPVDMPLPTTRHRTGTFMSNLSHSLSHALLPLASRRDRESQQREKERWLKHIQVCQACRDQIPRDSGPEHPESAKDSNAAVSVQVAISGMTCASCVNSINGAVASLETSNQIAPGTLQDFHVNLLSASATFIAKDSDVPKVLEAIQDAGFDAEVVKKEQPGHKFNSSDRKSSASNLATSTAWQATLSIKGMTCASCVNGVNSAIQPFTKPDTPIRVTDHQVNLLDSSASLSLESGSQTTLDAVRSHIDQIREAIEDSGFDAEVVQVDKVPDKPQANQTTQRRTARVRIEGMFCGHCVAKVRGFFSETQASHPDSFQVQDDELDAFSLNRPYVSFNYVSDASSSITLRSILAKLGALDPSFQASYAPPPSLASRSAVLAKKELDSLINRLIIAFIFAIPTLLFSMIAPLLLPMDHSINRRLNMLVWGGATFGEVLMWAISTPVQFGVGSIFFQRAYKSVASVWRKGRSWNERLFRFGNMDVLVALGTSIAYFTSLAFLVVDVVRGPRSLPGRARAQLSSYQEQEAEMGMTYFEVSVFLIFFILLGRVMESVSKKKTGDAVAELGKMKPTSAQLILDPSRPTQSRTDTVAVDLLEIGDLVLIPSGSSPPLDGTFVGSKAQFDESSLSGEARPVSKKHGDEVFSGTANVSSHPVIARVSTLPGHSMIDDILDVVREASGRKASIEQLADAITGIFVPCIVYLSLFVLALWSLILYRGWVSDQWIRDHVPHYRESGARFLFALQFAISCLLISCPCAIGLAAPTAQLSGIGLASQQGILVNGGGEAFRTASAAARGKKKLTVVFDKTGTITRGEAGTIVDHVFLSGGKVDEQVLLKCVALAEQGSTHPIGVSLRSFCQARLEDSKAHEDPSLESVEEEAGKGMRAHFRLTDGSEVELLVGNRKLMDSAGVTWTADLESTVSQWQGEAKSVVFIATAAGGLSAALAVSDTIRPEAGWVIRYLRERYDADVWMVSGDNERTARAVAAAVGIADTNVVAGVLPTEKRDWVEALQSGRSLEPASPRSVVCFVGDGINDSPAIAASDLGIALGSGSSIAHSSADFILLQRTAPLVSIASVLSLARATDLKILSNFAWAFVFNVSLVPIAAGILMPLGIKLGPELSGMAMALSSTSVVLNSLSLRLWSPPKRITSYYST